METKNTKNTPKCPTFINFFHSIDYVIEEE